MTGKEKDIYNYLLGKEGKKRADEYMARIESEVNQRMTDATKEKYKAYAEEHPASALGINALASTLAGRGAFEAALNNIVGKETDTNSEAFLPNAIREGINY